jgi:cytochrome b6-f complex iron-sulfur subunit
MNIIEVSFATFAVVGVLGIIGIATVVTGRAPKSFNWKKNVEKKALKDDKSKSNFLEPDLPKGESESTEEAESTVEVTADQTVKLEEKEVFEEISEEEAGITRRQFLTKALRISFGAFAGIQLISYLGFFWPKISGGFGSKVDAGTVEELKNQIFQSDGSVLPAFIPSARAYVLPLSDAAASKSQFSSGGTVAEGLVAVYQRCVHLGCRVPWCNSSQGFECPCHGSKYNMVGEYFAGPAPRNLDRFNVSVVSGRFIIDTGTIIESPRAPEMSVKYPQGLSCIALTTEE